MKFAFLIEYFDVKCNAWTSIGMTVSKSMVAGLEIAETTVRMLFKALPQTKFRIIAVADDGCIEYEHRVQEPNDLVKRASDSSLN